MNLFWTLLVILVIAVFVFVIFPSWFDVPMHASSVSTTQMRMNTANESNNTENTEITEKDVQQLEVKESKVLLNNFYKPANRSVPVDYPRKKVGECPFSKPQSMDLPVVDVPMCFAVSENNMRITTMA
jgi:hypothetical protein